MGTINAYHGRRVYLDTNFFIYTLENFAPAAAAVAKLGEMIQNGELLAYTSELTLAEVLVVPVRQGDQRLIDLYSDLVTTRDGLSVIPVTYVMFGSRPPPSGPRRHSSCPTPCTSPPPGGPPARRS